MTGVYWVALVDSVIVNAGVRMSVGLWPQRKAVFVAQAGSNGRDLYGLQTRLPLDSWRS